MDSANSKQNNTITILLAILLVVVVAIATLLFLTLSGKTTGNNPAPTNADAAFTAGPQPTVTETVRETVRDTNTSSASSKPTKLGNKGWIDDSATQCGSSEELWAAGREGTNYITICSNDGGSSFRYRANVNGGQLDIKKVRATDPDNGRYTVEASPSTIEIYSTKLEVWTGDNLQKTLTFDSSWYEGE